MPGIYVEIPIQEELDTLWHRTQDPAAHRQWDLRFTDIDYLPREGDEVQRFRYRTRIGFGLTIAGEGETVGEAKLADGSRSDLRVEDGGICLRSGAQRFYEGPLAFTFPAIGTGIAEVREWFDDDTGRFQIRVVVHNQRFGPLFGYRGSFVAEFPRVTPGFLPAHLVPRRWERRD